MALTYPSPIGPVKFECPSNPITLIDIRRFYNEYFFPFLPNSKQEPTLNDFIVAYEGEKWVAGIIQSPISQGKCEVFCFNYTEASSLSTFSCSNIRWPNHGWTEKRGLFFSGSVEFEVPSHKREKLYQVISNGIKQYNAYIDKLYNSVVYAFENNQIISYQNASRNNKNEHCGDYVLDGVYDAYFNLFGRYDGKIVLNKRDDDNFATFTVANEKSYPMTALKEYRGQYHDDKPSGIGSVYFRNSDSYHGDIENAMPKGFGLFESHQEKVLMYRKWNFQESKVDALWWKQAAVQDKELLFGKFFDKIGEKEQKQIGFYFGEASGFIKFGSVHAETEKGGLGMFIDFLGDWLYIGHFVDAKLNGWGVALGNKTVKIGNWQAGQLFEQGLVANSKRTSSNNTVEFYSDDWKLDSNFAYGSAVNVLNHPKSLILMEEFKVFLNMNRTDTMEKFSADRGNQNLFDFALDFFSSIVKPALEQTVQNLPAKMSNAATWSSNTIPSIYDKSKDAWYYTNTTEITNMMHCIHLYHQKEIERSNFITHNVKQGLSVTEGSESLKALNKITEQASALRQRLLDTMKLHDFLFNDADDDNNHNSHNN